MGRLGYFCGTVGTITGTTVRRVVWEFLDGDDELSVDGIARLECLENLKERAREVRELTAAAAASTTIAAVLAEQQRLERLSQSL